MVTEEKKEVVKRLAEKFEKAESMVLSDYRGLNAQEMTEMREYFTKEEIEYEVVKNTLATIAAREVGLDDLGQYFEGPTGVALGYDDPVLPFKISSNCQDDFGAFSNKGGVLEQEVVDVAEFEAISNLSSKDDLYGQVAIAFKAPIQKLATALQAKLNELADVLNQVAEKKQG